MSYTNGKKKRQRSHNVKFQTAKGMAEMRHMQEIFNARLNRGEIENPEQIASTSHVICGCGYPGCGFISVRRKEAAGI